MIFMGAPMQAPRSYTPLISALANCLLIQTIDELIYSFAYWSIYIIHLYISKPKKSVVANE